jgi:hypothetical protein
VDTVGTKVALSHCKEFGSAALGLVLIGSTGTAFAQAAGHEVAPSGAPSIDFDEQWPRAPR